MFSEPVRVLLVDDDEDDYYLTRDLLRSIEGARYELAWVSSYQEALDEICKDKYHACLIDYRLGPHDGITLIRQASARNCSAALILLTGLDDRQVDLAAMKAGAADYVSKVELSAPLLERSIRYSIQQRRAEKQRIALFHEQVARREAESANQAKDQFLATLSHELRTPLNAILGWAQILTMGNVDEETLKQAIEAIERNAKAQAQLIEDLLDVSRIVSGKVRLEIVPVNILAVIDAAIGSVRHSAEKKEVAIVKDVDSELGQIRGDATRLQQVIWNLLSNAIKFTPSGGQITVRVTCDESRINVVVRDTGKGIEAAFLPYVFDRFSQADSSTTRSHAGLGLGLAIVRQLVQLHGGSVDVASPGPGQGSTFSVHLPLAADDAGDQCSTPSNRLDGGRKRALDGSSILVVDDDPDARTFISKALQFHGASVNNASNVADALQTFESVSPTAIVTDIAMPGEDGFSLLRKLRAQQSAEQRTVPVVAVTAHASQQDRDHALEAGFDEHLAKPVETAKLVAILANLIERGTSV